MFQMIDSKILQEAINVLIPDHIFFNDIGLVSMKHSEKLLSFVDNQRFLKQALSNEMVGGLFVTASIAEKINNTKIFLIIVDDPRWCFYSLMNYLAQQSYHQLPSGLHSTSNIHPTAYVAPYNVIIEPRVQIGAGAIILPDVKIGQDSIIRSGSIIGEPGFEHKRTTKGILTVIHDGQVIIGDRVEIGPVCTIIKGFKFRQTIIGNDCKFDAQVHFAHGSQIGQRGFIAASAMIAGSVTIGEDVWIGPGSNITNGIMIGNRSRVTIGSTVLKDVDSDQTVTGYLAQEHRLFLKKYMSIFR